MYVQPLYLCLSFLLLAQHASDTHSHHSPGPVIFNMFDNDGSGTIDEEEFMNLCTCTTQAQRVNMPQAAHLVPPNSPHMLPTVVNDGAPTYPGNFQNALEQFDVNDGTSTQQRHMCMGGDWHSSN